jgi:hypothetical protein
MLQSQICLFAKGAIMLSQERLVNKCSFLDVMAT